MQRGKTKGTTYVLRSAVVLTVVGAAIPAAFVYHVRTDAAFRDHFERRFPDFMREVQWAYVDQPPSEDDTAVAVRKKDEVMMVVVATMQSGRRFRVHVTSLATMDTITMAARKLGADENDIAIEIQVEDEKVLEEDEEEPENDREVNGVDFGDEPIPVSTWPEVRPTRASKRMNPQVRAEWHLAEIQGRVDELRLEKRQGTREIDVIDQELKQAEEELERLKPARKKWLGLF